MTQELSITTFRYVPRRSCAARMGDGGRRTASRYSEPGAARPYAARRRERSSRTPSSAAVTCCARASSISTPNGGRRGGAGDRGRRGRGTVGRAAEGRHGVVGGVLGPVAALKASAEKLAVRQGFVRLRASASAGLHRVSEPSRRSSRWNRARAKADGGEAGIRTLGRSLKPLQRFSKPPLSATQPPHRTGIPIDFAIPCVAAGHRLGLWAPPVRPKRRAPSGLDVSAAANYKA